MLTVWRWAGVAAAAGLMAMPLAWGQADTAHAREVFASVNNKLPTLATVRFVAKRTDVDYRSQTRAWLDAGVVSKIEHTAFDDSGNVITEYYYANGQLVFALRTVTGFKDGGSAPKVVTTGEDRFYFRNARMFKWLSGMGRDQTDQPAQSADFAAEQKALLHESTLLVAAANAAYAKQGGAKAAR